MSTNLQHVQIPNGQAIPSAEKTYTLTIGAAANGSIPFSVEDVLGTLEGIGGGGYSISLTQTGGTGNGAVNDGDISVDVLP